MLVRSLVVALRKESVDRNCQYSGQRSQETSSLSARRAWIEIVRGAIAAYPVFVALRKESVDRNGKIIVPAPAVMVSLSARRAWIEISARHRAAPQK